MRLDRADPSVWAVADVVAARGHTVFLNDARPWNLNLVGVRTADPELDEFGCWLVAFWPDGAGGIEGRRWRITTLPGAYYLRMKLLNPRGCAILAPGQYRGAYGLDYHRGEYLALCQRHGPVTVYRDGDRDAEFDLDPRARHRGWFGINIHRGKANGRTEIVGRHSAGCQVFASAGDFDEFLELCRLARREWGPRFTYTLI